jgi:flagellar basal body-associated protein FliL
VAGAGTAKSGNALKIILIVVAVIVGLGILGIAGVAFTAWRIASHTRVHQRDGNVRVETPFGTVNTTSDPDEAARNLGIDLYPGAEVVKGTSANLNFGGMRSASAEFESSDPAATVADFYKSKFPNARFVSSEGDRYTIVSSQDKNMLTIGIESRNGRTRIHVAKVTGKPGGGDSEN